MSFKFPQCLFWIGSPLDCKPHNDMSGIQKFVKDFPDWAVIIVVEKEEERLAIATGIERLRFPEGHPGGLVIVWNNDSDLLDMLCGDLHFVSVWKIVGAAWYECEDSHVAASTLAAPLEKCPTCEKPVKFIRMHEERVKRFTEILKSAVDLMNFDTRSGIALNQSVNPTANVMKNLPYAMGLPEAKALDLEDFFGKGRGKRAILLSAGPSMKRSIDVIKKVQNDAIILCVGRVFKMLYAQGVRVDYTFSCEMFDWDSVIFDGITKEMAGDTIMCYPPVCAPATVKAWPGKRLCVFDANTGELLDRKIVMMGGNSVSHHMYNFAAEILQCEQVILVGQDLSYTESGPITHVEGSNHAWPDAVKKEDSNFQAEDWGPCTSDKLGPFYPDCHKSAVVIAPGSMVPVGPILVRTSPAYKCFGNLFSILIGRHKKKTFNACSNGLKIDGAPYVDLAALPALENC